MSETRDRASEIAEMAYGRFAGGRPSPDSVGAIAVETVADAIRAALDEKVVEIERLRARGEALEKEAKLGRDLCARAYNAIMREGWEAGESVDEVTADLKWHGIDERKPARVEAHR